MSAYASPFSRAAMRKLLSGLATPPGAPAIFYAVAYAASRIFGEGATGHAMLVIGPAVAIGVLLRRGRGLTLADAVGIAAVHAAIATLAGDAPAQWIVTLLRDLLEIVCGSLAFLQMRRWGLIDSDLGMIRAVGAVALAGPLAALPLDLALTVAAGGDLMRVAARFAADAAGIALALPVVLTYGRGRGPVMELGLPEARPHPWEYVAASLHVAALTLWAVHGGQAVAATAASVALLWFALRLGSLSTSVAAFAFSATLLAFAGEGRWPSLFSAAGALEEELLRYVSLVLLAAPSVIVAAVVADHKRQKRLFAYRATHDGLTTLVNRVHFREVLEKSVNCARARRCRFALFLIDLDFFKSVNDTYGHARGDKLLIEVANRLRGSVRVTDVVARIGGDEFAVVAPVSASVDAIGLARRLVENVNKPCDLDGVEVTPSVTVGAAMSPDTSTEVERLLELADAALYDAKAAGRNCWMIASSERPTRWTAPASMAEGETVFLD